jgi:hypothetical protein
MIEDHSRVWHIIELIFMMVLLAFIIGLLIALNAMGSWFAECWHNASKCIHIF